MKHVWQTKRVGIFRGTFDPIHSGHLSFAETVYRLANLDELYFLPEPNPLHKRAVGDFDLRLEMISRSLESFPNFGLLNKSNLHGSIHQILPYLRELFQSAQFVFLMGSDVARSLPEWSDLEALCKNNELVVGLRGNDTTKEITSLLSSLPTRAHKTNIIKAPMPTAASSSIRTNVSKKIHSEEILNTVHDFVNSNRLYRESDPAS